MAVIHVQALILARRTAHLAPRQGVPLDLLLRRPDDPPEPPVRVRRVRVAPVGRIFLAPAALVVDLVALESRPEFGVAGIPLPVAPAPRGLVLVVGLAALLPLTVVARLLVRVLVRHGRSL